ncbi:hypothetical protein [Streptomyces venezuelae]|uniref:hypothetical protein n=1 Tax=Streptomyces venezuelae TaxID=54571 RepID=UPI00344534CA
MTLPSYSVDDSTLALALDDAHERIQRAEDRLARVACAYIAEAVRDVLTDGDPDAPFDAARLRLVRQQGRTSLCTDGTYWTTSGEERRFDSTELMDSLAGLTDQLHDGNAPVWTPLCQQDATGYRLDLTQAAQLPDEVSQSPRVAEIRERLAAATRAPWSAEEIVYNRAGGIVSPGDPQAVHTDFVVTDAYDSRVAEIAVNHDGPDDTETPAQDLADSRANATLIAHAPEDLRFLLAYLDHCAEARTPSPLSCAATAVTAAPPCTPRPPPSHRPRWTASPCASIVACPGAAPSSSSTSCAHEPHASTRGPPVHRAASSRPTSWPGDGRGNRARPR